MTTAFYATQHSMAISGYVSEPVNPPQPEEQYISTFFCRALYDYQTGDASSLSFRKNDIIEVLTRLESGWWDGLLGDERGWFPSNYVTVISDQEAEAALGAPDASVTQSSVTSDSVVDMAHSMSRALSGSSGENDWLDSEVDYPATKQLLNNQQQPQTNGHTNGSGIQHNDFWVPQVSSDGRIFYVNTQTGQHSRDLPTEVEDPDGELAALSPSSSRAPVNTAAVLAAAQALGQAVSSDSNGAAGFGLPQRTRTPEPWVRRLADDGLSYYYQNRLNGQVSWTLPESDEPPAYSNGRSESSTSISTMASSSQPMQRLRSGSTASRTRGRSDSAAASVYSDDSDVQPLPRARARAESSANGTKVVRPLPSHARAQEQFALTQAEEIAKSLQNALFPPPPELPMELAQHVRDAVALVTDYLQAAGPSRRPEQAKEIDSRVLGVVAAVRNLLYCTATPTGHIPSHLYPRGSDSRSSSSAQGLQAHLKAAQRKVAGTLSKLVLSALALQYDPVQSINDKPNRMESDARELERSVAAFVLEVQRFQQEHPSSGAQQNNNVKRLRGVFVSENIGLALPGAGVTASWKGFGYLPTDYHPSRTLRSDLVAELKAAVGPLSNKLHELVAVSHDSADLLQAEGQGITAYLSSLLAVINDINVAQHVDIDGLRAESGATAIYMQYMQSVEKARHLLRTLELATQTLYDDSASLFLTIQQSHVQEQYYDLSFVDRSVQHDHIDALAEAISSNLRVVTDVLEGMVAVGHDQADIGQATYSTSIQWRQSRLSILDGAVDPFMQPRQPEQEDVVDMELAFARPGMRTMTSMETGGSSTLYQNGSQYSETSLGMSDRSRSEDPNEPVTPTWPSQDTSDAGTFIGAPSSNDDLLDGQSSPLLDDFDEAGPSSVKSPPRAAKLMKLLGSDAPQHYLAKLNADAKPWYLRPNYDQSEILIDPDGGVRAGTTTALVERLTAHEHGDPTFIKNFLMTFKSFMTLDELFNLLVNRYWIKPPENLNPTELEEWTKLKQHVIRMRVLNTFKAMVTDDDLLEKEDMWILDRMKDFASNPEVVSFAAAKQIIILIERAQKGGDGPIKTTNTLPNAPPAPILPKSSKKLKLLDIDPVELSRQLTLMEATLYKKIRPMECLQRSREAKPGKTPDNITSIIQLSNRIANWVADTILEREDSRKRATIVKHFISVADRCRGMQNFSTMVAIISGLNTPPIRRLKRTWEQVNARFMTQLGTCEATIDTNKNFNNYRSTLARITPPCVPFIGVYLTTLTFINDGAEDKISGQMVNFRKRQKAAEVIQDIKRWQAIPYSYQTVATVLAYLEESFNKYGDGVDYGDQFWNTSLQREPREREDEKMARLLQESGFL
ncbi:unnamed protein product [Somion occarium]|uniref:Ras GEF n=1 Tax=Somion occarium TaxID=3059160 RepID=A0ABP1E065_9APHY